MKEFMKNLFSGSQPTATRKQNDTRPIDKREGKDQREVRRTESEQMEVDDGIKTSSVEPVEPETRNPEGHILHGEKSGIHESLTTGKKGHCESSNGSNTGTVVADHNTSEKHCNNCELHQREVIQLQKKAAGFEIQLKSTQFELAQIQQRRIQDNKSSQRRIQEIHDEHRKAERRLFNEREHARHQWRDADSKRMESEDENTRLREKLRTCEHDYKQMAQLLEERTADIKGAQMFLTAADLHSGADIINMVEGLNEGIFQLAAFTAELVEDETMAASEAERHLNMQENEKWLDLLNRRSAPELYTYLAGNSSQVRNNPMPLQLIIQQLIASWCTYESQIVHAGLKDLYNDIGLQEMQAVTGRWRALASLELSREGGNSSEDDTLFRIIVASLYLCGWSSSNTNAEKATEAIRKMGSGIEKQQRRLKRAITQEVTTADMDVFIYEPGALFLQDEMENNYEEARGSLGSLDNATQVLCTVGMGLRKSVTNRGQRQTSLLVKAQVVLNAVLLNFDPATE